MSGPRSGQNQGEGSQFSLADNQADATALKICLTTLPAPHTYIPHACFPLRSACSYEEITFM